MKRNRISQTPERSGSPRSGSSGSSSSKPRSSVHISDYFAILREHKWVAAVPFLLILGGAVALTLLSTPVYQADAMLAIDTSSANSGLLGELQLTDTGAKVEAEMELMQSYRVAEIAAALLTAPTEAELATLDEQQRDEFKNEARHMSDFLVEVNRYRPLEVAMRVFRKEHRSECAVELKCAPLPDGHGAENFTFLFTKRGKQPRTYELEVAKVKKSRFGSDRQTELVTIESGKEFDAFGRAFTLFVSGEPTGRLYQLTLRSRAGIAKWLRKGTVVAQMGRNTGIVAFGSQAETPRLAQQASSALARSFVWAKTKQKRLDAGLAADFLEDQVTAAHTDLGRAEDALGEFQNDHGVTILSEKAKALVDAVAKLEREKIDYVLRLEEQERLLDALQTGRIDADSVTLYVQSEDPTAGSLASQLTQLELQYAALTEDLTDEMPQVKSLKTRIEAARAKLRAHLISTADAAARATLKRIKHIDDYREKKIEQAKALPRQERDLAKLTRGVRSAEAIYNFLLEKQSEAQIAKESVFSNVRIVDEPLLPGERVSPNLLVNVLVGLFLATVAALGTAFFAEYLDRSIKTPEDLERALDLPLYAALPAFKSIKSRDMRKLKSPMVTIEKPHSTLAEGYRSLRANIRFADFESPVRAFAITSAVLGEGKTTTSLNLAVVLAQAGSKVMVVDADLRRPATHVHLKGQLSPGLSDILSNKAEWQTVKRAIPGVENLDVIHAGAKPSNPGAMLDSDNFLELVEELKSHYEYILFDVPPVLAVSDAASFFHKLDALFLLVQWRRCPIHVVQAAKEQAQRLGANLRGVIFNGFDARKSGRRGYGHYGYYGYYGYYGKYRGYGYVSDSERKGKPAATAKK